ncbi:MAG: hypothetical protein WCI92_00015 [Bacteroidota bacterium]
MKRTDMNKDKKDISPDSDPDENEKYLIRLKIQQDVIRKIMDPIEAQIKKDKLKEAESRVKRK